MKNSTLEFKKQENGLYKMIIDGEIIGTDLTIDEVMSIISRVEDADESG